DVKWRSGGLEQPGREARVALTLPAEIELRPLPAGETLAQHLDDGRIDGLISALAPSCFGHNPAVRRLFPDYRAAEEAYFERTRMFPVMHVVGIRRSLLEKHPWLAVNTYVAYQQAKEICYRRRVTIVPARAVDAARTGGSSMAKKLRLGLIGASVKGTWSSRSHLPALQASADVELTAVCTTRADSADAPRQAYAARLAFDDWRKMVA